MRFSKVYLSILIGAFLCSTMLCAALTNEKLLIMTSIANHADFIKVQNNTLNKFLKDDYEYIVFNDAFDEKESKEITDTCLELGILCMRIPQENRGTPSWMLKEYSQFVEDYPWWSMMAFRHEQAISYMMRTKGFDHEGIVVLLDADLFLITDFSIANFLEDYDIAGVRLGYEPNRLHFWPGLMFFRMDRLPNKETMEFAPVMTKELTLNTGGSLYRYLEANPDVKKLFFKQKGRLLFNHDFSARYVLAAGNHESIQCQSCRGTDKKCCHIVEVLKELGFREKTLDLIRQEKFPGGGEFVLEDTFFHFRSVSNSPTIAHHDNNMNWEEVDEKFRKFDLFIKDILDF